MRGMARRGGAGQARTATRAKPPLRAMSMPQGILNWALVPTPSRKPRAPLPATVETSRVARSMRRMLWLPCSCDASGGGDAYSAEEPPEERQQLARSVMAVAPSHVRGDVCSLACALSAGWWGAWSPRGTWSTGQARTETMANVPLGSIATPFGVANWAFVPTPSR